MPSVGTAHSFTAVALHGTGLAKNLPTLGCRFGDRVTVLHGTAPGAASVTCLTPSNAPGFVLVGFAHMTGKTYAPGRTWWMSLSTS